MGIHVGIHWDELLRTRAGGCGLELAETLKEWTAADYPRRTFKEEVMGSNPIRATDPASLLRLPRARPVVKDARRPDPRQARRPHRVQAVVVAYENGIVTPGVA